uniref:Uncharacterized protein n=1 Tax=Glossina brevipalpis TaxID=37001 RepID=A0A1A9W894_9MUSC
MCSTSTRSVYIHRSNAKAISSSISLQSSSLAPTKISSRHSSERACSTNLWAGTALFFIFIAISEYVERPYSDATVIAKRDTKHSPPISLSVEAAAAALLYFRSNSA